MSDHSLTLTLSLSVTGAASAAASFSSVCDVLATARDVAEHLVDVVPEAGDGSHLGSLILLHDAGSLFRLEPVDSAARGAGELHSVRVVPDERYVELVAAIASDADADITFSHDWPILSVGASNKATVAGRGEVTSLSPEGRGGAA